MDFIPIQTLGLGDFVNPNSYRDWTLIFHPLLENFKSWKKAPLSLAHTRQLFLPKWFLMYKFTFQRNTQKEMHLTSYISTNLEILLKLTILKRYHRLYLKIKRTFEQCEYILFDIHILRYDIFFKLLDLKKS